jgi:type I restriction enzyme R subunit
MARQASSKPPNLRRHAAGGWKFTAVYCLNHVTSNKQDDVCRATICTILRFYSMLRGEEPHENVDELSGYPIISAADQPKEVQYNPATLSRPSM